MWPMAVEVRPEAWLVPMRPSCPVDRLPATAAIWVVVRALSWAVVSACTCTLDRPPTWVEVRAAMSLVLMACRFTELKEFRVATATPWMPLVDNAAICVVVMLVPKALTWTEVKTPSAWVVRLERFVVAMWPMAVEVRPEAWLVPMRPSWPVDRLPATAATWLVVRALT